MNFDHLPKESRGISVVIPCLNESETIFRAVEEALEGVRLSGLKGEVIVADNGSRDDSRELAEKAGARVVNISRRGYGAALDGGIRSANFDFVVFGDADLSYPFVEIPRMVEVLDRQGLDFVLANRLNSKMQPGAMPYLNRFLGTPILSWLIRRLYGFPIYDCNSGMRLFRKSIYHRMNLVCPGMEYASEMIIACAQHKVRYQEIDIPFRRDQRSKPPHLKRWRDGWRHLRLILAGAGWGLGVATPLVLGLLAFLGAFVLSFGELYRPEKPLNYHSAFALISIGGPFLILAMGQALIRAMLVESGKLKSVPIEKLQSWSESSAPFYFSAFLFFLSAVQGSWVIYLWSLVDFGEFQQMGAVIRLIVFSFLGTVILSFDMMLGILRLIPRGGSK